MAIPNQRSIEFENVWSEIISSFRVDHASIHGPKHWKREEANGLQIAARNGANVDVVRLFAVLHDSCREDDAFEMEHGLKAAKYAKDLRGRLFDLADDSFDLLYCACEWHSHGKLSSDPTIGACWDADRLDLVRIGIIPDPRFLSTPAGREIASAGHRMS